MEADAAGRNIGDEAIARQRAAGNLDFGDAVDLAPPRAAFLFSLYSLCAIHCAHLSMPWSMPG